MNLQEVLKNSVAVGLLVMVLNLSRCEHNSNRNFSCLAKEIRATSQESNKIFMDKNGQVWHFYSNYSDEQDSSSDPDQYGVFY